MTKIRLILKFIFFLPGTFMHELAHYAAALLLGKAEGFSVWPKIDGNSFVFGSVRSRTRFRVLSSFIAAAPLIWWAILILVLRYLHFVGIEEGLPKVDVGLIADRLRSFTYADALFSWITIQILWAGRPSLKDVKNFLAGFFSVSGLLFISAVAGLVYIIRAAR